MGVMGVTDASSAIFPDVSVRLQLFSLEFAFKRSTEEAGGLLSA